MVLVGLDADGRTDLAAAFGGRDSGRLGAGLLRAGLGDGRDAGECAAAFGGAGRREAVDLAGDFFSFDLGIARATGGTVPESENERRTIQGCESSVKDSGRTIWIRSSREVGFSGSSLASGLKIGNSKVGIHFLHGGDQAFVVGLSARIAADKHLGKTALPEEDFDRLDGHQIENEGSRER